MTEQLDMFGGAKTIGRTAPRQDAVLEHLKAHPDGISVDEAGQAAHASAGKHDIETVCKYCGIDGRQILRTLERKRLVRRAGNGQFVLRIEEAADAAFGEFPDGY